MARKDRRRASTDARIELRKQVIELRRAGRSLQEIAQITGYAASYCSTLYAKYGQEPEALQTLARGGRPTASGRALTAVQERQIQEWVCRRCPDQLQLPFALWTRRAVQTLISRRFGVKLSIHAVGEYLARWGYTPQRPLKRAYERDESRVKVWLSKEFPAIAQRAKAERAEINWGDETGLRSDESRHRGYAPRGQTPVVRVPARRKSLSLISAITNQGKVRFMIYPGALNTRHLIVFMQRLTRDARRKVYLILDNLNVHKAAPVRTWLAEHRDDIEVFFLPPYSPELNPDEYLNGDLKRAVHQDVPPQDREQLHAITLGHLRRIQKSPGRVRRYFRHRSIRYAAAQTSNARRAG